MALVADDDGVFDWWAHNGGKFDIAFLLDAVVRMGWTASGFVAAGRAIQFSVKVPGLKKALRFFDSFAVVPAKLSKAADSFGLKSRKLLGDDDYRVDVRRWTHARLEAGCRADCEVVLELLDVVEAQLDSWGGGLRSTFSGAALSVVESRVDLPDTRPWRTANEFCRPAYVGGRVEVLNHAPKGQLAAYDVTSSYPWSLTQPLPLNEPEWVDGADVERLVDEGSGIIEAEVTVPASMWLPPLPYVLEDEGVYFPTGTWTARFSAVELRYAKSLGCTVKPQLGIRFTTEKPFDSFVRDVFQVKRNATGAKREFAKYLLNGCYGKFGQKPEKDNLVVFATRAAGLAYLESPAAQGKAMPLGGRGGDERFVSVEILRWSKRTHYALASTVTAASRVLLHKYLTTSVRPAYCDTDSVHAASSTRFPKDWLGGGLGQLKQEHARMSARYFAPKLYELHPDEGAAVYKSKGFTLTNKKTGKPDAAKFKRMTGMKPIPGGRMQLVRTQLRKGGAPKWLETEKVWKGHSTKRRPLPDGGTVPWTVTELQAGKHRDALSPLVLGKRVGTKRKAKR